MAPEGAGPLTWSKCRVQHINVDSDVDSRVLHTTANLIYDALDSIGVKISRCDSSKSTTPIVLHIPFWPIQ